MPRVRQGTRAVGGCLRLSSDKGNNGDGRHRAESETDRNAIPDIRAVDHGNSERM